MRRLSREHRCQIPVHDAARAVVGWQSKRQEKCAAYAPYKVRFCAGYAGYNRTVRHEWLDQYMFATIEEVQDYATRWLWTYNNDRPNMGLGGMTPAQKLKLQTAA